jgi:tRNA pseudouridine55 synthase
MIKSLRNEDGTGILLVDKPTDMTSHDVVAIARRKLGIRKIGHAGTLDPLATGLLILLVGRQYTKQQDAFMKQDKEYVCTAELGVVTDSYDSDGTIVKKAAWQAVQKITKQQVIDVMKNFTGEIEQTVPIYSAVKVKGQKLYNLARQEQKVEIELPTRQVTIKELELLSFTKDEKRQKSTFTFRTFVSSGTYIRSLAHDIGQVLTIGAMVTSLRRTKIGDAEVDNALSIDEIA